AFRFVVPPNQCHYLPEKVASLEYEVFTKISPAEYLTRMRDGWRRFGHALFRPRCPRCTACQTLRVPIERFRPNRSQPRAVAANADLRVTIGTPAVEAERLALYDRFHAFQARNKSWPEHGPQDASEFAHSFVDNPFPTEEWRYFQGERLIGIGYADVLPEGMSAIYFFYDPDERRRSLGTFNVLCLIEAAARRRLPYLYLGYY